MITTLGLSLSLDLCVNFGLGLGLDLVVGFGVGLVCTKQPLLKAIQLLLRAWF